MDNQCRTFDAIQYSLALLPTDIGSKMSLSVHNDVFVGGILRFLLLIHGVALVCDRTGAVKSGVEVGFGECPTQDGGSGGDGLPQRLKVTRGTVFS